MCGKFEEIKNKPLKELVYFTEKDIEYFSDLNISTISELLGPTKGLTKNLKLFEEIENGQEKLTKLKETLFDCDLSEYTNFVDDKKKGLLL